MARRGVVIPNGIDIGTAVGGKAGIRVMVTVQAIGMTIMTEGREGIVRDHVRPLGGKVTVSITGGEGCMTKTERAFIPKGIADARGQYRQMIIGIRPANQRGRGSTNGVTKRLKHLAKRRAKERISKSYPSSLHRLTPRPVALPGITYLRWSLTRTRTIRQNFRRVNHRHP